MFSFNDKAKVTYAACELELIQEQTNLDEGMRDGFGLIFGIVSRCLKLHKNMLFLMEIL